MIYLLDIKLYIYHIQSHSNRVYIYIYIYIHMSIYILHYICMKCILWPYTCFMHYHLSRKYFAYMYHIQQVYLFYFYKISIVHLFTNIHVHIHILSYSVDAQNRAGAHGGGDTGGSGDDDSRVPVRTSPSTVPFCSVFKYQRWGYG